MTTVPESSLRVTVAAFDALTAHVAILDPHGVIIAVNAAWRAFAAQNGGLDDVGVNYLDVCGAATGSDREDATRIAAGIRDVLAGRATLFELEYPCHSPHEERFFVARVTAFTQDNVQYAVVAHENITRRKRAELGLIALNRDLEARVAARTQDLERSNRDLEQFAYVASHDLQEPLRTLGAYADILRHRYEGTLDARADGYLEHIVSQVSRARQLVRDVLTLASITAAAPTLRVDLTVLWDAAVAGLPWPEDARVERPTSLPDVQATPSQMEQLLTNVLGNTLKFRSERPLRVTLAATLDGDMVHFMVRDNGIGIEEKHAEQVFLMFQRLHTRARISGNGIGLAVCRRIVERHGGRMWIEPGVEGLAMHFTLPAATGKMGSGQGDARS